MLADPAFRRAALLAAGAHVLVLAGLSSALAPALRPAAGGAPASFLVRQIAPQRQGPGPSLHPAPATTASGSRPMVGEEDLPDPAQANRSGAVNPPTPVAAAPAAAPLPLDYLPRSALSVAPQPLAQVHVPFPEDVRGFVDLRVQFALFIDPQGQVRRVRLDSEGVPPSFARAIHDAFLAARFKPGEVDGMPVASLIRLEVEFGTGAAR